MNAELEQQFKQLANWSNSLAKVVPTVEAQVREILDGGRPLPSNCPSKESMAELILREIDKKLSEVNAARDAITKAVWKK